MRGPSTLWVAALLVGAGSAAVVFPGADLLERNQPSCEEDSCLSQVIHGRNAKADCSSYLKATVTPCPVISLTSIETTLTAPALTITSKTTIPFTEIAGTPVALSTMSKTTKTVFSTTKVTIVSTHIGTLTTTLYAKGPMKQKREAPTTCPVVHQPTKIPSYADDCKGTAYSSACACIGAEIASTTLPQSTQVVRTTHKTTVTPLATSTSLISVTTTFTKIYPTTLLSTETSTIVRSETYLQTSTTTITIEVLPKPTQCFNAEWSVRGEYLDSTNDHGRSTFILEGGEKPKFRMTDSGRGSGFLVEEKNNASLLLYVGPPPAAVDDGHFSVIYADQREDFTGTPKNLICAIDSAFYLRCQAMTPSGSLQTQLLRCAIPGMDAQLAISDGTVPGFCYAIDLINARNVDCYEGPWDRFWRWFVHEDIRKFPMCSRY